MTSLGGGVLLLYALAMLAGGVAGWAKTRSLPSLIAGAASGIVLLVAWVISRRAPVAGFWLGALVALLLSVVFAMRLAKTAKFMPSGMLLLTSGLALLLLTYAALGAQGKL